MSNGFDNGKLQRMPAAHPYNPQPGHEETQLDTPTQKYTGFKPLNIRGAKDNRKLLPHEEAVVIDIYEDILREEPGIDSRLAMQLAYEQLREQPTFGYKKMGALKALTALGLI